MHASASSERPSRVIDVIGSVMAATTMLIWVLWYRDHSVMDDGRAVEASQALLLFVACLVHWRRIKSASDPVARSVRCGLAILCYSMFLREVDIDKLSEAVWAEHLENSLRLVAVGLWAVFAFRLRPIIPALWRQKRAIALGPAMLCSFAGVYFYLMSYLFDKQWLDIGLEVNEFGEGVSEVHATTMFLAGSLLSVFAGKAAREGGVAGSTTDDEADA